MVGLENVWALGDCAVVPNAYDGQPSPPVAQFAVRQAKQLAAKLRRAVSDQPTRPFSYRMLMFMRHPVKRLVVVAADQADRPIGTLTPFDILLHYTAKGTTTPRQD